VSHSAPQEFSAKLVLTKEDIVKIRLLAVVLGALLFTNAQAQFTGPSAAGRETTVAEVRDTRLGTYVTVTGRIVAHQRGDYYSFRDDTGEIRVEVDSATWRGRAVTPETKVRLLGEIDRGPAGRYLWVKSLEVLE
jgi:uncharacterized protein (TIGR00156 family)